VLNPWLLVIYFRHVFPARIKISDKNFVVNCTFVRSHLVLSRHPLIQGTFFSVSEVCAPVMDACMSLVCEGACVRVFSNAHVSGGWLVVAAQPWLYINISFSSSCSPSLHLGVGHVSNIYAAYFGIA